MIQLAIGGKLGPQVKVERNLSTCKTVRNGGLSVGGGKGLWASSDAKKVILMKKTVNF